MTVVCGQKHKGGCTFVGEKDTIHADRKKLEAHPTDLLKDAPLKE